MDPHSPVDVRCWRKLPLRRILCPSLRASCRSDFDVLCATRWRIVPFADIDGNAVVPQCIRISASASTATAKLIASRHFAQTAFATDVEHAPIQSAGVPFKIVGLALQDGQAATRNFDLRESDIGAATTPMVLHRS